MDLQLLSHIKKEYDAYTQHLLKSGYLPMWSTKKGFWNGAIVSEVFEAFSHLDLNKFSRFLDLGSGDGRVVMIASLFAKHAEGIEVDGYLHTTATQIKQKLGRQNVTLHHGDFYDHSLKDYDVVFINPDAPFHRGMQTKLNNELQGKVLVHGHHFLPESFAKEKSWLREGSLFTLYNKSR